jgi:glycosyltransferase involved in cell wall biosynthesis
MRIAFVTPEYVTEPKFDGGLANYIRRVALSLIEFGHQPVVFVSSNKDQSFMHDGVEVHRMQVVASPKVRWANVATFHRFSELIPIVWQSWKINRRVRRVHCQQPFALIQYPQIAGMGLFRPRDVPCIIRLSSYSPLWRANGGYKSGPKLIQVRQREFLEQIVMTQADAVFGPSQVIAGIVEQKIGKPVRVIETPYVTQHAPVDEQPYRDLLHNKPYLLFFGRIGMLKGVDRIGRLLPTLLEKYPDLYFVLVGRDDIPYQGGRMLDYVWGQSGPYRGRVLYLGRMGHQQLYPIIRHARAVVLPSRIDNLPNTCIEAMDCKQVVIGTRGTSFEQLIVDGESGLLCNNNDAESLLVAMERALHLTAEERARLGERAWERVQALHPNKTVNELLAFYQEMIVRKG